MATKVLTQQQIDELRKNNLSDSEIQTLATKNGYEMPKVTASQSLTPGQVFTMKEKGLSDTEISTLASQKGYSLPEQPEKQGLLKSIVTDPLKTLVVRPAVRAGQAIAGLGVSLFGSPETKQKFQEQIQKDVKVPFTGVTVEGVKPVGQGGFKQAIGEGASAASYLVGGGGVKATSEATKAAKVIQSLKEGVKTGAASGGLFSFGDAVQQAENSPSDVAYKTLFGTTIGAATVGGLSVLGPIAVKTKQGIQKFSNVEKLNEKLYATNNITLKPTAKEVEKWGQSKVDPIKTYTEIFATDVPKVDSSNRFTKESIDDAVEKINDVYKPASEAFNTILRNSPETISLTDRFNRAVQTIDTSNLTASGRKQAIENLAKEFDTIRNEALQTGTLIADDRLPVAIADNYKDRYWANTKKFGFEDAGVSNEVNRSIGRSFASGIEDAVTDVNVKNFNKQLQEYLVLRDFIASKAGKLAGEGGKMTRLLSRTAGAIVGSGGGPVTSTLGALTGDKLAQLWINPAYSPSRWLIIKQLKKLPVAERTRIQDEANAIIQSMYEKRINTLALPEPSFIPVGAKRDISGIDKQATQQLTDYYQSRNQMINDAIPNPMNADNI